MARERRVKKKSLEADPAIDGAKRGQNSSIFDGPGGLQRDHSRQQDELPVLGSFHGNCHVFAGEKVYDCDAFQSEAGACSDLLGGCQRRAGGGARSARRTVHFAGLAMVFPASLLELHATVNFTVDTFELQAGQKQKPAGTTAAIGFGGWFQSECREAVGGLQCGQDGGFFGRSLQCRDAGQNARAAPGHVTRRNQHEGLAVHFDDGGAFQSNAVAVMVQSIEDGARGSIGATLGRVDARARAGELAAAASQRDTATRVE